MININSKKADYLAAQKLLEETKKEYTEAIVEAAESGEIEAVIRGTWKERSGISGLKVYCSECRAISPNAVKHERCPHCGAIMSNSSIVVRFVESTIVEPKSIPDFTVTVVEKKHRSKTIDNELVKREVIAMLKDLKSFGMTYTDIGAKINYDYSGISKWAKGKLGISQEKLDALRALYKETFNREVEISQNVKGENDGKI